MLLERAVGRRVTESAMSWAREASAREGVGSVITCNLNMIKHDY